MSPGAENTTREDRLIFFKEMTEDKFVAALDVGTTTLRCCIFNQKAQLCGSGIDQVSFLEFSNIFFSIRNVMFYTVIFFR
mgnify:FL=1